MTKDAFRRRCEEGFLILDGATGTNLQKAGMPMGVSPEAWILSHQEVLLDLQRAYFEAGSDIVLAPTFTANRIKLAEYGLEDRIGEINRELVMISKKAAGSKGLVAGDMTMTGKQLEPIGPVSFESLVDVYKEQAGILADAGVDLFIIETMMSLAECRAAVLAVKETCDLPVCVTLSFNEDGRTLFGTDAKTAMVVLQSLGADAAGVNCSTGPEQMVSLVREMKEYANIPVIAKPNAGMPELVGRETVYRMTPQEFADACRELAKAGAGIIGGCCGTTPAHISALKAALSEENFPVISSQRKRVLASERQTLDIGLDGRFMVIGERINPTGKKKMQAALKAEDMDYIADMAQQQDQSGAAILDINMGMNGIDEKAMMKKSIMTVTQVVNLPLCIDSSHVDVIEEALRIYPGRALINSISMEKEKIEKLLPVAAKYGAMFILLPLSDKGLPEDQEEKREIIREILNRAQAAGLHKEDVIVDGLVATIGANKDAAIEVLDTITYCHDDLKLATVCGLSNISFGLPDRIVVNTAFLTMAISRGLTMAIANPAQSALMHAAFASDLLMHRPGSDTAYIEHMALFSEEASLEKATGAKPEAEDPVFEAVLKGGQSGIVSRIDAAIAGGTPPEQIIEGSLIPAIGRVGELFEKQKYYLPQLIASAETMERGMQHLEPMIRRDDVKEKGVVVIATVEGDIHDIGKNLVALMLRNYGYKVVDLGKDVSGDRILEAAVKEKADIIGLSALMTTTMMRMEDVVNLAREKDWQGKIIIGGAVTTQDFADMIGADGYSADAAQAVALVDRLMK